LGIGKPAGTTHAPKDGRRERQRKSSIALSPLPEISGRISTPSRDDESDAYLALMSRHRQKNVGTTPGLTMIADETLDEDQVPLYKQATSNSRSESRATNLSRTLVPPNTGNQMLGESPRAPSSLSSIGGTRSDIRLRIPFKQHIGNLDYVNQKSVGTAANFSASAMHPETTSWDILKVAEELAEKDSTLAQNEGSPRHGGRLRKARLQPLKPVQIEGPSIEQCAGIIAESQYNPRTMMDPFALRSELLSSFSPQEFQHWQDAAANLVSSSRRTSPILGVKGEDPLLVFARNYSTTEKIDHEKIQAFRQYAASHRASRSSSPGFPQHERELTSQGKARSEPRHQEIP